VVSRLCAKTLQGEDAMSSHNRSQEASAELNGQRWLTMKLQAIGLPSRTRGQPRIRRCDADRIKPVSKALLMITVSAALFTVSAVLWTLVYLMAR
jgi:hypothetical protein